MNKNGKNINCKICNKEFYISGSRIGTKKYCSIDCAKKDEFGFKSRNKNCEVCGTPFLIEKQLRSQDKYCSIPCKKEAFKEKQEIRYARLKTESVEGNCKECLKSFTYTKYFKRIYCSKECQNTYSSKNRKAEKNPAFVNGKYTGVKREKRSQSSIHLSACSSYRRDFIKKNEYLFCEICRINQNGTQRFQVHHIYFASLYPRHKELHNFKNLILVCLECHYKFHAGKTYIDEFKRLEKDRGLKKLFSEQQTKIS